MRTAKEIALIGIFTAILIGGQFALSGITGVEVVTVLLLGFSYCFGVKDGVAAATAFSLLRCFIFGFFPTVIILYLIYYPLFAVVFGLLGKKFRCGFDLKIHSVLLAVACIMTALFTALDDLITPLYYGFSLSTAKAYAVASLAAVIPQLICTIATVALLLPVLLKIFKGAFKESKLRGDK